MTTDIKTKIGMIIKDYVKLQPEEYELFRKEMKQQRENNATKFAEVKEADTIDRKLFEMPETLHAMIKVRLSDDEYNWWRTKEGAHWFINSYQDFRSTQSV